MALQRSFRHATGIVAPQAYSKITFIRLDRHNRRCQFTVLTYADKTQCGPDGHPLEDLEVLVDGQDFSDRIAPCIDQGAGALTAALYSLLKGRPGFTGTLDV